jgi:hypothetical protein
MDEQTNGRMNEWMHEWKKIVEVKECMRTKERGMDGGANMQLASWVDERAGE